MNFAIAHVGSRTSFDDRLSACVCELCEEKPMYRWKYTKLNK